MNPKTLETASRLNLIRILSSAPHGLTLKELSQASGISSEAELKAALGKLYMIGTYPYTPWDYIEVDFDGTFVRLHLGQNSPGSIALTPKEWVLLRNSLIQEKDQHKPASDIFKSIETAIQKIRNIVPFSEHASYSQDKDTIRKAIRERRSLSFQYLGRDGEKPEDRKIDPWYIMDGTQSYLLGFCHTRKSPRIFRLESIFELKLTSLIFDPPNRAVTQKSLDEFNQFVSTSRQASLIAGIWHTRASRYYLNLIFQLETGDRTRVINGTEFIYSTCAIQDSVWFLDHFIGFLPDVILDSPKELISQLNALLKSAIR